MQSVRMFEIRLRYRTGQTSSTVESTAQCLVCSTSTETWLESEYSRRLSEFMAIICFQGYSTDVCVPISALPGMIVFAKKELQRLNLLG